MKATQSGRKGPPKSFTTVREAREALTHLADSLTTHSFTWPAAAIRSYLSGRSESLDTAFGLGDLGRPKPASKTTTARKSGASAKAAAPSKQKKPGAALKTQRRR